MGLEPAPVPSPIAAPQSHKPVPAAIRVSATLSRAARRSLLHGELLRLSRWRRHQFSWLLGIVLIVMLAHANWTPGLLRVVILLLLAGSRRRQHAGQPVCRRPRRLPGLRAEPARNGRGDSGQGDRDSCCSRWSPRLRSSRSWSRGGVAWPAIVVGVVLAAGLFAWTAAVGMITSMLFPSASDPQSIGGSLVNNSAFVVIAMAGSALYWRGRAAWLSWSTPAAPARGLRTRRRWAWSR